MAMTPAERKAAQRARMAIEGIAEVRGIYAPIELHQSIRAVITRSIPHLKDVAARVAAREKKKAKA